MVRCLSKLSFAFILGSTICAVGQNGQPVPSQNVMSSSGTRGEAVQPSAVQPVKESADTAVDPASLLPDLPALPPSKASLIGGTVAKLDRVRDEITVQIFGGGKMKISFDARTSIYRGANLVSTADLRQGDRVYIDTILNGDTVFARNIRLKSVASAGESQGTVVGYHADKNELLLRDALSPEALRIRLTPQTQVVQGNRTSSLSALIPGTLVAIKFATQQNGNDVARQISVLAVPGSTFTFAGRVTGLDLRLGLMVLTSSTDGKTYEVYLDPAAVTVNDKLREAADVSVVARFDGSRYVAQSLTVNPQN
jgi:hypothetical protein